MKKKTTAQLKKILWKHFSLLIRTRDGGVCFVCGRVAQGSGYHASHFIAKSIGGLNLYFEPTNVFGTCYNCNINLGGNLYEFGLKLGPAKIKKLKELQKEKPIWDRYMYEILIEAAKKDFSSYERAYSDLQKAREKIKENIKK